MSVKAKTHSDQTIFFQSYLINAVFRKIFTSLAIRKEKIKVKHIQKLME